MSNARPFLDFLREHRGGTTHDELSDAMQELVAAITQEGKGGSLTFTVSIKPAGKSGALEVSDEIKVRAPKQTKSASIFFASPDNNLIRNDPRQTTMELRQIPPASAHMGVA